MRRLCLAAVLLSSVAPALAQVLPQATGGDPHLQEIGYDAGQIVHLRGAPGYQMMIELSPDEQIQNVAIGESDDENSRPRARDQLFRM